MIAIEIGVLQKAPEDIDNLFRRCIAGFLYSKAVNQYVKNNLTEDSKEEDVSYLLQEYGDLVGEGHLFDCNTIF